MDEPGKPASLAYILRLLSVAPGIGASSYSARKTHQAPTPGARAWGKRRILYIDVMNFAEVVRKRRMVRHFTSEPVPRETVERIVQTAQHAPSAGFSQGVSFVVVTDQETRR